MTCHYIPLYYNMLDYTTLHYTLLAVIAARARHPPTSFLGRNLCIGPVSAKDVTPRHHVTVTGSLLCPHVFAPAFINARLLGACPTLSGNSP